MRGWLGKEKREGEKEGKNVVQGLRGGKRGGGRGGEDKKKWGLGGLMSRGGERQAVESGGGGE